MEMLSMGPGRRSDDTLLQIADDTHAEPVDLGVRSRPDANSGEPMDLGQRAPGTDTSREDPAVVPADHWLAGLWRPEVLGVSGAVLLLLLAIGLPFMSAMEMFPFYGPIAESGAAWAFVPSLLTAAVAAVLGLGGMRQAHYRGAAAWARVTSAVAAVVGALVTMGAAVAWFAATQSDLFERLN